MAAVGCIPSVQGFLWKPGGTAEEEQLIPGTRGRARCGFTGKAKRPQGHTLSGTLAILLLSLPPASVESALGNLFLLLVNGYMHGRPSLGANLPRAGAAVRGQVLSCPRLSFRAPASGFYGYGLFSLELTTNRILQPCFSGSGWRPKSKEHALFAFYLCGFSLLAVGILECVNKVK